MARNDQHLKEEIQVNKLNKELKSLCLENNLYLIDHGSTINNGTVSIKSSYNRHNSNGAHNLMNIMPNL